MSAPASSVQEVQAAQATNGDVPVGRTGDLANIPISKIQESQVALRPVNKEDEKYLGLVDSIKKNGILNPIVVRELPDPEHPGEFVYGLIDGLHRYNAALDAGVKVVPVHIKNMGQAEVEEAQIIANVQKIDTKPIQYTRQLERLLLRNPLMTLPILADKLSVSVTWLYERFGLLKLNEDIQALVEDKKIKLNNASNLAKLPPEEQPHWVDRAITQDPGEFIPAVSARMKELKEARRQGRAAGPATFEPQPHQRKWSEIKQEYLYKNMAREFPVRHNANTPEEAWNLAIAWCANMDPDSQREQLAEHEAREQKKKEEKERLAAEKEEKKKQEAAARAAEIKEKMAASPVHAKA